MAVVSNLPTGRSVEASTRSIVTQASYDGATNTQVRSKTGSGVWNTASVRTSWRRSRKYMTRDRERTTQTDLIRSIC